jgi:hypothetical protein
MFYLASNSFLGRSTDPSGNSDKNNLRVFNARFRSREHKSNRSASTNVTVLTSHSQAALGIITK